MHWAPADLRRYQNLPEEIPSVAMRNIRLRRGNATHTVRVVVTTALRLPNAINAKAGFIPAGARVGVVGLPLQLDHANALRWLWNRLQFWVTSSPISELARRALEDATAAKFSGRHVPQLDFVEQSSIPGRLVKPDRLWDGDKLRIDVLVVSCDPVSILAAAQMLGVDAARDLQALARHVQQLGMRLDLNERLMGLWSAFVRPMLWFPTDAETHLSVLAYMVSLQGQLRHHRPQLPDSNGPVVELTDGRVKEILEQLPSSSIRRALWERVKSARKWCGLTNTRATEALHGLEPTARGRLLVVPSVGTPYNLDRLAAMALRERPALQMVIVPVRPKGSRVVLTVKRDSENWPDLQALRAVAGAEDAPTHGTFWTRLSIGEIETALQDFNDERSSGGRH